MRGLYISLLFFVLRTNTYAAYPVPGEVFFADMQLQLSSEARNIISNDVDAIRRNAKFFQLKVDRANLYFPIIEKIFLEEGFPADFKYLSLQESSLVSDAVSSSNAVGYWQFKKETAIEVGMRVDNEVDERMNIVSSTKGAMRYLKKNNYFLDNWVYALLSYNLGLGGVKSRVEEKYRGEKKMKIDGDMHWYVLRMIAHKLAYEGEVGKGFHPEYYLVQYFNGANKSLNDISKETGIAIDNLTLYNKWVLKDKIPSDKTYAVILPVLHEKKDDLIVKYEQPQQNEVKHIEKSTTPIKVNKVKVDRNYNSTIEVEVKGWERKDMVQIVKINNVLAIKAMEGDNLARLALKSGVGVESLLRFNEMQSFDKVTPGKFYYIQVKRTKAIVATHVVQPGETIWDIAQKYAVKTQAIRTKNRMTKSERLNEGRVLWLKKKRPKETPVEYKENPLNKKDDKMIPSVKVDTIKPIKQDTIAVNNSSQQIAKQQVDSVFSPLISGTNKTLHIVKNGETLYSISKLYNLSVDSLIKWNSLNGAGIKIGQELLLKKTDAPILQKKQLVYHIVQAGETIYKISRDYKVSVADLLLWNNKSEPVIKIDEKLIIYVIDP